MWVGGRAIIRNPVLVYSVQKGLYFGEDVFLLCDMRLSSVFIFSRVGVCFAELLGRSLFIIYYYYYYYCCFSIAVLIYCCSFFPLIFFYIYISFWEKKRK